MDAVINLKFFEALDGNPLHHLKKRRVNRHATQYADRKRDNGPSTHNLVRSSVDLSIIGNSRKKLFLNTNISIQKMISYSKFYL